MADPLPFIDLAHFVRTAIENGFILTRMPKSRLGFSANEYGKGREAGWNACVAAVERNMLLIPPYLLESAKQSVAPGEQLGQRDEATDSTTNRSQHMRSLLALGALASALATVIPLGPAHGTLMIAADFNGTIFGCVDNTACDTNPLVGTLAVADQTIGGITFAGSIQRSLGTPANPFPVDLLSTSSLSLINVSGVLANIAVTVGDTDFFAPVANWSTSGSGVWELGLGSTINLGWYADAANLQGGESVGDTPGVLLDSFAAVSGNVTDSFSHNGAGTLPMVSVFSMTESVSGTLVAGGSLVNRGQSAVFTPVPEPASMALFGAGMVGLGLMRRRKTNAAAGQTEGAL